MIQPTKRPLSTYRFADINKQIQQLTQQGHRVLRLDIGSPDMPPPQAIRDSLADTASQTDSHGYMSYPGIEAFRQAIADYYQQRVGIAVDPDTEVVVLMGCKDGITKLSLVYLDPGDTVLVPSPGYPVYAKMAQFIGADVYYLPLTLNHQFKPVLDDVPSSVLDAAKLLWLNYPNNPTGATATLDDYRQWVQVCQKHNILLACDNPYLDVTYDGYQAPSVLQADPDKTQSVEFISFSKTYHMAGWRLGAAVGNAQVISHLKLIQSNMDTGHSKAVQMAGVTALNDTPQTWIDQRNQIYQRRRDKILKVLPNIGLTAHTPLGAMYIWAKTDHGDGDAYTQHMLHTHHVSLTPGSIYGNDCREYVRFSVSVSDTHLDDALDRLQRCTLDK